MITVEQFSAEFSKRHDFTYQDFDFLPEKYSHICFKDIPEAWVCLINSTLSMLEDNTKVKSIKQYHGFCVVDYENVSETDLTLLVSLDAGLRLIDVDLHEQLEDGIVLH